MAFNVILRLRRDTQANYQLVAASFVPKDGEVCLVDTEHYGLRFKVGDGKSTISQLPYEDLKDGIVRGYYNPADKEFYYDSIFTPETKFYKTPERLYVDATYGDLYYFDADDEEYVKFTKKLPTASSSQAGILRLYSDYKDGDGNLQYNTDGSMTQKATIEAIQGSLKLTVDAYASESISFTGFNIVNTNE